MQAPQIVKGVKPVYGILFLLVLALFLPKDLRYIGKIRKEIQASPHTVMDISAYYTGGAVATKGLSPYRLQNLEQERLAQGSYEQKPFSAFIYPPCTLPYYQALARLPFGVAYALSATLLVGLLAVVAIFLFKQLKSTAGQWQAAGVAILVCLQPQAWANIHAGQANIFVLAAMVGAVYFSQRKHSYAGFLAGVLLAAAVGVKLFPAVAFPALWVGAYQRRGLFTGFCLGLLAFFAVGISVYPVSFTTDYITLLQSTGGIFGVNFGNMPSATLGNQSLNGLFANLASAAIGGSSTPALLRSTSWYPICVSVIAGVAVLAGITYLRGLWVSFRAPARFPLLVLVFFPLLAYQLVSPMVWSIQLFLVAPLIAYIAICQLPTAKPAVQVFAFFTTAIYITGLYHNLLDLPVLRAQACWVLAILSGYSTVYLLGLFVAIVWGLWQTPSANARPF